MPGDQNFNLNVDLDLSKLRDFFRGKQLAELEGSLASVRDALAQLESENRMLQQRNTELEAELRKFKGSSDELAADAKSILRHLFKVRHMHVEKLCQLIGKSENEVMYHLDALEEKGLVEDHNFMDLEEGFKHYYSIESLGRKMVMDVLGQGE